MGPDTHLWGGSRAGGWQSPWGQRPFQWEVEGGWDGSVPAALRAAATDLHPSKMPGTFQEPGCVLDGLSSCQTDVVCFVMASPRGNVPLSPHSPDTHQGSPPSVPPPHHCALSWCGGVHTQAPHYGSKVGSAPGSAGNRAPGSPIPTASPWGCSHRARGHSYACWGLRPAGSSQQWEAIHLHPGPQRTTKSFNLLRHLVP